MIEKIKKVSNPLTIIAIFAALAEINGTVAIGLVRADLQHIFIWFIILFPTLLIVLFFLTLNFNPKVIYAPSDFQNEENFLKAVSGGIYFNKFSYSVTQDKKDIAQVKQKLIEARKVTDQATQIPIEERSLTNKANSFFEIFINQVSELFDNKKLESLKFGIHTPEYFLLEFKIAKDKLNHERIVSERSIIIKVKIENDQTISLEAIGQGIKETDQEIFASKLSTLVVNIVDGATDPKNAPNF
jgi:hypothetical protein